MSGDHNMHQNDFRPDWDTVKAFDDRYADDTALLWQALEVLKLLERDIDWHDGSPTRKVCVETIAAIKERLK